MSKKPKCCGRCGCELSEKELATNAAFICSACERNQADRQRERVEREQ